MDIKEKAKAYAEGKALSAITIAIEEAYAAGYNDALSIKKEPDVVEDNIEFVDLHLKDGTLWASDYLRGKDGEIIYCTYDEAVPLGIPTAEQFNNLIRGCKVSLIKPQEGNDEEKMYKIAVLDKHICLSSTKDFWVKDYILPDTEIRRTCVKSMKITKCDKNEKLPVILVKHKV